MHNVQVAAAEHVTHCGMSSEHNWHLVFEFIAYELLTHFVQTEHDEHVTQFDIAVVQVTHVAAVCLQ